MQRNEEMNQLGTNQPRVQDESEIRIAQHQPFVYLKNSDKIITYTTSGVTSDLINYKGRYRLVYCVIIPDDSKKSDDEFRLTLKSINESVTDVKQIAICTFLLQITCKETLKLFSVDLPQYDRYSPESFCCKFMGSSQDSSSIEIFFNYKELMTPIQAIRCFHSRIINDLHSNELFAIVIENGVKFPPDAVKMMLTLVNQNQSNQISNKIAVVPALESLGKSLFGRIQKYENLHYNMYDLHYYSVACSVPVSSKFSLIKITEAVQKQLSVFYYGIPFDASLSYHDYKLGVFLEDEGYDVLYVPSIVAEVSEPDLEFPTIMEHYSERNQANLAIFFDLGKSFVNCRHCSGNKALRKIILFFQLIGIITDFIFPSLMAEVMFVIFTDALAPTPGGKEQMAATFFTIFYILLIILAGIYGLMSPKLTGQYRINFIAFFFVFDIYYLFILICSVIAMDNINRKQVDLYTFNVAALVVMIVLNVIFGLIPLVINFKKVIQNCTDLIIYFFLGCPNYSSLFAIHSLFNATDAKGNKDNAKSKAILLLVFVMANAFFGFLIFVMNDRSTRVNCVLALAIIFTIYNGFKMIAIIVAQLTCSNAYEDIIERSKAPMVNIIEQNAMPQGMDQNELSTYNNRNSNTNDIHNQKPFEENGNEYNNDANNQKVNRNKNNYISDENDIDIKLDNEVPTKKGEEDDNYNGNEEINEDEEEDKE